MSRRELCATGHLSAVAYCTEIGLREGLEAEARSSAAGSKRSVPTADASHHLIRQAVW